MSFRSLRLPAQTLRNSQKKNARNIKQAGFLTRFHRTIAPSRKKTVATCSVLNLTVAGPFRIFT